MDNIGAAKSTSLTPAIWTKDNPHRILIFDFERQTNLPPEKKYYLYKKAGPFSGKTKR